MSITKKVTVGLVSLAFVFSFVTASSATAASDSEIATLQAQIAALLDQIKDLQSAQKSGSGSTYTTTTTTTGGTAACSFTWTRNLSIGSTGDDVRQLQRFLNGNPQTQVAVSGAGSPGNESSYYGPATARAVSKFQELYAAQILTPLGLTKGTGGFYTSTRTHLNEVCQRGTASNISINKSGSRSATTAAVVRVTGDALVATPGNPISDSYVVLGAQRAPFTSVVLTAGTDDVRIENIRIKRFGLSSSDNFESIALVDANGVQVGSARGLNSRDEVSLGSNFVIPANRSVTLAVVGNMTTDTEAFSSGSIAGLEVAEVIADTRVQGKFPIRGAAHVLSESVDLQKVVVDVSGGGGTIEFNEEAEVASVNVSLDSDTVGGDEADREDSYLRSIILEQVGSADEREIGDLEVFVDDDKVNHTIAVDRDRYIINFGGKGVLIEEGEDVEITLETTTDRGYEETIQFAIDDPSDLYILGASYGYGLPVCISGDDGSDDNECNGKEDTGETWDNMTAEATISSGRVADGNRLKKFEDEVRYGDDIILGAYSVEFEGEDVLMEDLSFKVELNLPSGLWTSATDNAWIDADEDTVRFDSVRLRVDGENVAYADSVDFDEPTCRARYDNDADCDGTPNETDDDGRLDVEFEGAFTIDVKKDREVIFEIVADLDSAWGDFEGAQVEFTLVDVDTAEGVNSDRDYTDTGEYFASDIDFKDVRIKGNQVTFAINDDGMDGTNFVRGADDVVFGTLEINARDAIDDIELRKLYVSFQIPADTGTDLADQVAGDLSDLDNCRILDSGGDEIADSRGVTGEKTIESSPYSNDPAQNDQARFNFDDFVVEAGEREKVDIVCDINDDATAEDQYQIVVDDGSAVEDRVEYRIGRDEDDYYLEDGDESSLVTVDTSGVLEISVRNPDDDNAVMAVATGSRSGVDNVAVLEIELEADKEDISIEDVYLELPANMGAQGSSAVATSTAALEEVYDQFTLKLGNTTADADDYKATKTFAVADYDNLAGGSAISASHVIEFEGVGETIEDGEDNKEKFDLTVDFTGIDENDGSAGQFIQGSKLIIVWEGDDSGTTNVTERSIDADDFTAALPFTSVPTVSSTGTTYTDDDGKLYEFTVTAADEGDVYLGQITVNIILDNDPALNGALTLRRGTKSSSPVVKEIASASAGDNTIEFTDAEEVGAGESQTYSVWSDITWHASNDNQAVKVRLTQDDKGTPSLGRLHSALKGSSKFVWSPNALNNDGDIDSSNDDWFNGWTIFDTSDVAQWKNVK